MVSHTMAKGQLSHNFLPLLDLTFPALPSVLEVVVMARGQLNHMAQELLSTPVTLPASMVQLPMAFLIMAREMLRLPQRLKLAQMLRLMLMPSMATMAMFQLPMVVMAMDGQVATPPSLAFTDMDTHTPTGVKQ